MELISNVEKWYSYLKHGVTADTMTEKEVRFIASLKNYGVNNLTQKQYWWLKSLAKKYGYGQKENPNYWRHRNLD